MSASSTDDEQMAEEEMLEDDYGGYGHDWAASYGFLASPPAAPLASGSTVDVKGKGKAKEAGSEDVSTEAQSKVDQPKEELTPQRKRNQEQLTKLSAVNDYTVSALLRGDPTPISAMPTHTKLVQSLQILHDVYAQAQHSHFSAHPPTHPDSATAPEPFPTSAYAQLLELLGGALSDVTASPASFSAAVGAARAKKTVYELQLERARLSMDPARPWTAPSTTGNGWGTASEPTEGLTREQLEDIDLADLVADNTRAALLILRPPLFPDTQPDSSSAVPLDAVSSPPVTTNSASPSPISRLPSELLSHILSLARSLSEQRMPGGVGFTDPVYDDAGYPRSVIMPRRRIPGVGQIEGSRTAGQRFALSLALVCREWRAPARRIAFRSLHCRKTGQMQKLLQLLETSPETIDPDWITNLNAKILKSPEVVGNGFGVGIVRGYSRYVGGGASWATGHQLGATGSSSAAAEAMQKSEESSPAAIFAKLVAKAPRLRTLGVNIVGNPYSVGFGGRGAAVAEFLEPPILSALSNIPTLTSLILDCAIDFEELELIIAGLPSLESLQLLAVDSINGSGNVASPGPHPATNLRSFTLGDSAQYRDLTSMSETQLAWLLEPSATSGKLQEVDITVLSGNGGGWGPLGGGMQPNQPPPYASGLVADLLQRSASSLKRLALRDMSAIGGGGQYASFSNAPHNSNFDHVLTQCTALEELVIQFTYTSTLFDCIQHSPNLTSLVLLGTPGPQTRAEDLASRLEDPEGQFKKLERLVISGQWFGRGLQGGLGAGAGGGGWTGGEARRIKAICREREKKVACSFNSV